MIKIMLRQHSGVLGLFEEFGNRVLDTLSAMIIDGVEGCVAAVLTLDINLKTDV